ncbi:hypothetical protein AVEN_135308-1 [Araneus ventricosus]|uniref:Uncharacterized protein n=1 Tax=Araneus ventricosus TaxID=182803 RepID=A0A4Y2NB64_ARAVE|nr:hypothetical protein AVEN_135308-1 [Araneus ventricosus]
MLVKLACKLAMPAGSSTAWNTVFSPMDRCPATKPWAVEMIPTTPSSVKPGPGNTYPELFTSTWSPQLLMKSEQAHTVSSSIRTAHHWQEDAANNYARGHYTIGKELIDLVLTGSISHGNAPCGYRRKRSPFRTLTVAEITGTPASWNPSRCRCEVRSQTWKKIMACSPAGDTKLKDVNALLLHKSRRTTSFVDWCPTDLRMSLSASHRRLGGDSKCSGAAYHNTAIAVLIQVWITPET